MCQNRDRSYRNAGRTLARSRTLDDTPCRGREGVGRSRAAHPLKISNLFHFKVPAPPRYTREKVTTYIHGHI